MTVFKDDIDKAV